MWCSVIRIEMFNVVQILGQSEWTCEQRMAQLLLIQTWWQTGGKIIATAFAQKTFALSIELYYVAQCLCLNTVQCNRRCGAKIIVWTFYRQSTNFQSIRHSCSASQASSCRHFEVKSADFICTHLRYSSLVLNPMWSIVCLHFGLIVRLCVALRILKCGFLRLKCDLSGRWGEALVTSPPPTC